MGAGGRGTCCCPSSFAPSLLVEFMTASTVVVMAFAGCCSLPAQHLMHSSVPLPLQHSIVQASLSVWFPVQRQSQVWRVDNARDEASSEPKDSPRAHFSTGTKEVAPKILYPLAFTVVKHQPPAFWCN